MQPNNQTVGGEQWSKSYQTKFVPRRGEIESLPKQCVADEQQSQLLPKKNEANYLASEQTFTKTSCS
jgi:hypothetical protein